MLQPRGNDCQNSDHITFGNHQIPLCCSKRAELEGWSPFSCIYYPRILEWPGLKRTTMLIQFQPPALCRVASHQPRLPRATSSLALNACRDGASTASLGNLFSASPPYRLSSGWRDFWLLVSIPTLRLCRRKVLCNHEQELSK